MKALMRPGGGDAGPSDGDQVIYVLPGLWMCIFMMYLGKLEMLW